MAKNKTEATTTEEYGNVIVPNSTTTTATNNPTIHPGSSRELTQKEVFENLRDEMVKYGIHSIGQLEVKISQL